MLEPNPIVVGTQTSLIKALSLGEVIKAAIEADAAILGQASINSRTSNPKN